MGASTIAPILIYINNECHVKALEWSDQATKVVNVHRV